MNKIIIPLPLASMNEYSNAQRAHKAKGARTKKGDTELGVDGDIPHRQRQSKSRDNRVGGINMTNRTIILDDLKFDYTETELARFIKYWNEYSKHSGNTIEKVRQISRDLKMSVDNTFLVILHLEREGRI